MKKIIIFLSLSLFVISTQSCKKPPLPQPEEENTGTTSEGGNEEEEEVLPSPFAGTWDYTKIELTNGELEIMNNVLGTFEGSGSEISGELVITENPNRYTTSLAFTADISVFNQQQSLPVDRKNSSGTWTEANGEITLKDDNGNDVGVISSTSSKIVFTGEFTEQIDAQFGSINATSDVIFTVEK